MDVTVALYFYHLGVSHGVYHYWYFGLTITFILVRLVRIGPLGFETGINNKHGKKSHKIYCKNLPI